MKKCATSGSDYSPGGLSGWARLWIVILVPIWVIAVGISLNFEITLNKNLRIYTIQDPKGRIIKFESLDAKTALHKADEWGHANPNVKNTYFQQLTPYLNRYQRFIVAVINPTLWIILIFALAMLAKRAVTWVWQGFNPQMKPKRENDKNSDG